ncbi:uncharacterized protein PV09_06983 [Verruconis gallopava]|uniref:Ig-like domain-containing protein n=1 Tax=Verruconis gallopava TaxID=253628 RepID=A0A0D2AQT2_9PEZI|nr:uncharacterized protein PV09_06983 [Verruconis gallopava]KIW01504.1 hypothetical protein PV09_06983 [Verruconis gallopava]
MYSVSALKVLPLFSLLLVTVTEAVRIIPRDNNSSSITSPAPLASCTASCHALNGITTWHWVKATITGTVTAATVIYIVDERTNQTRTTTKLNTLPANVTMPPTNAAGTHISQIPVETEVGKTTTVEVAYPTEFVAYPLSYYWYGTLPTTDSNGKSVCSTLDSENREYITFSSYKTPAQETPTSTDSADKPGFTYALLSEVCYFRPIATINIGDAAPTLCSLEAVCPEAAVQTVMFLTETSVSHESSTPDPTPDPAPENTSKPGTSATALPENQSSIFSPSPTSPQGQSGQTGPASPAGQISSVNQPTVTPSRDGSQSTSLSSFTPLPTPIVLGGETASFDSLTNLVIGSQTVSQGSQITVGANTVSLASGGSVVVVNGKTESLVVAPTTAAVVISFGSITATANSDGNFVFSTLGHQTTVSLSTNGAGKTVAVVDGKTETVSTLPTSSSNAIGGAIASGIELSNKGLQLMRADYTRLSMLIVVLVAVVCNL